MGDLAAARHQRGRAPVSEGRRGESVRCASPGTFSRACSRRKRVARESHRRWAAEGGHKDDVGLLIGAKGTGDEGSRQVVMGPFKGTHVRAKWGDGWPMRMCVRRGAASGGHVHGLAASGGRCTCAWRGQQCRRQRGHCGDGSAAKGIGWAAVLVTACNALIFKKNRIL
jgi:hypothetical protein